MDRWLYQISELNRLSKRIGINIVGLIRPEAKWTNYDQAALGLKKNFLFKNIK